MVSASSHRFEDFDAVARRERVGAEAGTRHHVPVHGYGDAPAFQPQRLDELLDGLHSYMNAQLMALGDDE